MQQPTSQDLPMTLTAQQVATMLHCSVEQVYKYCREGAIPKVNIGRLVRIPTGPFLKWLEDGGFQPAPVPANVARLVRREVPTG